MIYRMEVANPNPSAVALPMGDSEIANDDPVQIREITGLDPVKASVSSTPYATARGEYFQGASTGTRNIVLTLGLNPNWEDQTVASLRKQLYGYFIPEEWTRLTFFSDDYPPVEIEGIVESVQVNIFSLDPEIQVSIISHKPDFVDPVPVIVRGEIPASLADDEAVEHVIAYDGTVKTGFSLKIYQDEGAADYNGQILMVNESPVVIENFSLDPVVLDSTKYLRIRTIDFDREVKTVANSDGAEVNLLRWHDPASGWPKLGPGENAFLLAAEAPGLLFELVYFNRFGGL